MENNAAGGPRSEGKPVKLSIVIPVYNEEQTILELIRRLISAPMLPNVAREIFCVNDCSNDDTAARLDGLPRVFASSRVSCNRNCPTSRLATD